MPFHMLSMQIKFLEEFHPLMLEPLALVPEKLKNP
jgi:hypothetical protein